jgi:hypothetical protein
MVQAKRSVRGHTGRTSRGNTRDLKVERVGAVTVYKRGVTYYIYYRESGRSVRRRVDGNLATARATASHVSAALNEDRSSPFAFHRTPPRQLVEGFLGSARTVHQLALRTQDHYCRRSTPRGRFDLYHSPSRFLTYAPVPQRPHPRPFEHRGSEPLHRFRRQCTSGPLCKWRGPVRYRIDLRSRSSR